MVLTFLMLQRPFSTVPPVVALTPRILSLLLRNCNFATVMNHIVNIWYADYLICDSQRGLDPQIETCWASESKHINGLRFDRETLSPLFSVLL